MTQEQLNDVNKGIRNAGLENIRNMILIKDGITNGGVIEALFPEAKIEIRNISVYVMFKIYKELYTNVLTFDKDWWDRPYDIEHFKSYKSEYTSPWKDQWFNGIAN